eukprot:UN15823
MSKVCLFKLLKLQRFEKNFCQKSSLGTFSPSRKLTK